MLNSKRMRLIEGDDVYYHQLLASVLVNITDEWKSARELLRETFGEGLGELPAHLVSQLCLKPLAEQGVIEMGCVQNSKKMYLSRRKSVKRGHQGGGHKEESVKLLLNTNQEEQ